MTSSHGSAGGGRRGRLKNSNDGCYEGKGDEGDLSNRGSGSGGGGGGGEGEMDVGGDGEVGDRGEGEGEEGENPRLSEARRKYPGFNLTGPDIYTSADDHCLQVSSCLKLIFFHLVFFYLVFSYFSCFTLFWTVLFLIFHFILCYFVLLLLIRFYLIL